MKHANAARIAENVAQVRGRIADGGARGGRPASDVTLVAVTKYVSAEAVRPLVAAGCVELGESRPQQLWEKAATLADLPVRWHLIGPLQRNKVRRTLPLVAMIHSVDSPRLLAAINEEWGAAVQLPSMARQSAHRAPSPARLAGGQRFWRSGQARLHFREHRAVAGGTGRLSATWRFAG